MLISGVNVGPPPGPPPGLDQVRVGVDPTTRPPTYSHRVTELGPHSAAKLARIIFQSFESVFLCFVFSESVRGACGFPHASVPSFWDRDRSAESPWLEDEKRTEQIASKM